MRTQGRTPIVMDQMGRSENQIKSSKSREHVRDQAYIKQYNIQSVLSLLKKHQPISRTEIARMTGMSPTSITRIVTALINQDLVSETSGDFRAGRGRKAANLCLNANGLFAVGIHLEKSVIRLCLINFADEVLYRGESLVDGECNPATMAQKAKELFDRIPAELLPDPECIRAVGVCLSGAVNPWQGIVTQSFRLNWFNENIGAAFSEAFGLPVSVENDVKACLIGEKVAHDIPDETDTAYLLINGGIGAAITTDGILMRGAHNEAGEITRVFLGEDETGRSDYLRYHMVEQFLVKRAQEHDPSIHNTDGILWAYTQGQEWAQEIIRDFRQHLLMSISMIDCLCNPEKIILGGGIFGKLSCMMEDILKDGHICLGGPHEDSCLIGAALIGIRSAAINMVGQSIE